MKKAFQETIQHFTFHAAAYISIKNYENRTNWGDRTRRRDRGRVGKGRKASGREKSGKSKVVEKKKGEEGIDKK